MIRFLKNWFTFGFVIAITLEKSYKKIEKELDKVNSLIYNEYKK